MKSNSSIRTRPSLHSCQDMWIKTAWSWCWTRDLARCHNPYSISQTWLSVKIKIVAAKTSTTLFTLQKSSRFFNSWLEDKALLFSLYKHSWRQPGFNVFCFFMDLFHVTFIKKKLVFELWTLYLNRIYSTCLKWEWGKLLFYTLLWRVCHPIQIIMRSGEIIPTLCSWGDNCSGKACLSHENPASFYKWKAWISLTVHIFSCHLYYTTLLSFYMMVYFPWW